MANPLSMYVPIKPDPITQGLAQLAADKFVESVRDGLNASQIVHYAKLVLIPNPDPKAENKILAIFLSTEFDGAMTPYLKVFWDDPGTQKAFAGVAALALVEPDPPVTDLTGFENFINSVNLSQPEDLYAAYNNTVKQIKAKPAAE